MDYQFFGKKRQEFISTHSLTPTKYCPQPKKA